MEIQIEPRLLNLLAGIEADVPKVVSQALEMWLKEKIPTCPLTKDFCINLKGSCNECSRMRSRNE